MGRSTIITGNGIGMALDPDYFSIQKGLEDAWHNGEQLSPEHKELIVSAIHGTSTDKAPRSEDQLDQLQLAIFSANFLSTFGTNKAYWLTPVAAELPVVFSQYIHDVAMYFSDSQLKIPDGFIRSISEYLNQTKSHLATLNYDDLLYSALTKTKVLDGYNGSLIDGFYRSSGFSTSNLDRNSIERFGWYLHLHGSPLFIGNKKAMGEERLFIKPNDQTHIVLTHIKHKPTIITASKILSEYWNRLDRAIDESSSIILFGYSGFDEHLNQIIQARSDDKTDRVILVVEWEGAGSQEERMKFWAEKTKSEKVKLVRMANILEFTDWTSCHEVAA